MTPDWLRLLAPLPDSAVPERRPVASAEQIATGTAGPIAGWESVALHLSAGDAGLRHVLITLDSEGKLLSGGDTVLFQRQEQRGDVLLTIYDQDSIGGRFDADGVFHGTRWRTHTEQIGEDDEGTMTSTPSPPSAEEAAALRRLVDDVLRR